MCLFKRTAVLVIAGWCLLAISAQAQFVPLASDEIKLQVAKQEFDEDAAGRPEPDQVDLLVRQFKITPESVRSIRGPKESWGEVILRLVLARELQKDQREKYDSLDEAVRRVGELRAARRPWREVAAELRLALGPVIKEAHRVREELRAQAKTMGGPEGGRGNEGPRRRPRD